jgi:8-oxo-dGTP diphosphatase
MAPDDDTSARGPIPLGPIGGYLIENLKALRGRTTYQELSARLTELGRPIPTLGLSRIEKGNRRVDVADLVALSIALDVNPVALLLPANMGPDNEIELTEGLRVKASVARDWLNGRVPLPQADVITWPRRPVQYHVHESEIEAVQRQLDFLKDALHATAPRRESATAQPVVAAIVTSSKGVLIGRRNDQTPPWTFIAGEQEPGEQPADTITRECKEESGLEIRAGDVLGERIHPGTNRLMIYVSAKPAGRSTKVIVGDEAELAEVRWVSLAEADALLPDMFPPVRAHLAAELGSGK